MVTDCHYRIQPSTTGYEAPYPMSHHDSSLAAASLGDWATLTAAFQLPPGWRGLLNVNAVPSSPLFPCFSLVAVSSDHSVSPLPGYTVSAASGWHAARTFPEVCQLLFSASRDKHLRIHKVKSSTDMKRFPLSLTCHFPANMS